LSPTAQTIPEASDAMREALTNAIPAGGHRGS
jgi:hypothetical protein